MSKKPNFSAVTSVLHKDKFKHGSLSVAFTAVFIAVIIIINILASALTDRFPGLNIDLTLEGLNTLSEEAFEVAKGIENETTIYIIGSEDAVRGDELYTNYGLKYSQVANLADRLAAANKNISVEFIDPDRNPSFISDYADDQLASGKVLIKTDKRYKVLSVTDLFSIQQDSTTYEVTYYSMVDGALANALYLVNLDTVPVVSIATGHDELLSTAYGNLESFIGFLEDNNFLVKEFNILQEEIPEDTSILFIGTPSKDYTDAEIEKLEAFINDENMTATRTIYFTGYPTQSWENMDNLTDFLNEWGLNPVTGVIQESNKDNVLTTNSGQASDIFATVNSEILEGTYENVVMSFAAPVERLFNANNSIVTYSVVETANTAYVTGYDEAAVENPDTGVQTIVALAQRYMNNLGSIQANVVVDGCSGNYLSYFLGNSTFGNKNVTLDFIKILTNTTDARVGISIKQTQTNTLDIAASSAVVWLLGFIVFTFIVPLALLATGLVIFLRRRHL